MKKNGVISHLQVKQFLPFHDDRYSQDRMFGGYKPAVKEYRALREIIVLPCANTIHDYFGKGGLNGGAQANEKTDKLSLTL